MAELKDMITFFRKRNGLSQRELAKRIGVSPSTIGMYESGKRFPTHEIEEALADVFNVTLNSLRGYDDDDFYITDTEKGLIESYRGLSEEAQRQIVLMIAFFKSQENNDEN